MSPSHAVVDGSNIATEGRSTPSLRQLDEAIRQFQEEFPDLEVIVVVDATFGHRIDTSERKIFDEAVAHGELVSPPAGAIGRGDAFVLRVAERVGALVLSNDSFQEFHAEHPWLFEEGRLIGGKPIPGVGWIFTPRLPVRGPRSRAATSPGTGRRRSSASGEYVPAVPTSPPPSRGTSKAAAAAIALATAESVVPVSRTTRERAKATKVDKTTKVAETTKAAKSTRAATGTKAAKSTKATKTGKEVKGAAKVAKAAKPAKAAGAAKSTKAAKKATKIGATKIGATKIGATKIGKEAREPAKAAKRTRAATSVASIKAAAKAAAASTAPTPAARPATTDKKASTTKKAAAAKAAGATKTADAAKTARTAKTAEAVTATAADTGVVGSGSSSSRRRRRGRGTAAAVRAAIEAATNEALAPDVSTAPAMPTRRRRSTTAPAATERAAATTSPARATVAPPAPAAVNDPLTFLTFVTEHPLGSTVVGTVSSFVSHGAMVDVDGMLCYLPLTGLGDPPPRRAREVVERGDELTFVLVALDPPRRGAELALPGVGRVPVIEDPDPVRAPSRRGRRSSRNGS